MYIYIYTHIDLAVGEPKHKVPGSPPSQPRSMLQCPRSHRQQLSPLLFFHLAKRVVRKWPCEGSKGALKRGVGPEWPSVSP